MTDRSLTPAPPVIVPPIAPALPKLARIRQRFDPTHIIDVHAATVESVRPQAERVLRPGMRVAITAGSRGIANIATILAGIVSVVRELGAEPFIVAAMGSHGGATADGQRAVLHGYGITEGNVGCPIVSDMETVRLGSEEQPVFVDRFAYESDAIILASRVKPHSALVGELGSGLLKMAAVGLGKREGAEYLHRSGLQTNLIPTARMVLKLAPVKLGVAIVENSLDQTWQIETARVDEIERTDQELLSVARSVFPNIPFDPLDVLVVDRVGKNFSGTGMDPNVVGIHRRIGGAPQREIRRIVALDLSEDSHGNANGIGMADIITERLRGKIDWNATYTNAITADFIEGCKLPITCSTEQQAVELAMKAFDTNTVRMVRVTDTAHLQEMLISEALVRELELHPELELIEEPQVMDLSTESHRVEELEELVGRTSE